MQQKTKTYQELNAEEQLDYVTRMTTFCEKHMSKLSTIGRAKWTKEQLDQMTDALKMLTIWPFSRQFAEQGLAYHDYPSRVKRLPFYFDLIKKEIAKTIGVTTSDGRILAYVPAMRQETKKRGRPSAEEKLAAQQQEPMDDDTRRQKDVAQMLGMDIVTNQTIREKNNDELRAEKAEREKKEAEQAPTLFEGNTQALVPTSMLPTPDVTRLHLDQLTWLMSKELAAEVANIRALRSSAAAASERAKLLAEQGASADVIKPYAQQAASDTKAYEIIYEQVDRELAEVYVRLDEDKRYVEQLKKKFGNVDVETLHNQLKPYFQKQSPDFLLLMKKKIDEEQPERVEQRKKEAEVEKEVKNIIRYIMRSDKDITETRVIGIENRIARLRELKGDKAADVYMPVLKKAKAELKKKNK